jgi:hypothetical protein
MEGSSSVRPVTRQHIAILLEFDDGFRTDGVGDEIDIAIEAFE